MPFTPQPPDFLMQRYSMVLWHGNRNSNCIYLTFDDGPTPGVTDIVLNTLEKKNIKATFFCIGKNVQNHPNLFQELKSAGHEIGNHTYGHLNLFRSGWREYEKDIRKCMDVFPSRLFRPPYGRITRSAIRKIKELGMQTVLWDIITYDFLPGMTPAECNRILRKHLKNGSIIVFHDSLKASENMRKSLDFLITYSRCLGLEFGLITDVLK